MVFENIIFELVIIFAGAAMLATLFLYLRQPVILAYIVLGVAIGPWGFGVINDPDHIEELSHIGIILLLFLIGLDLQPERLYILFSKISIVTMATCFAFLALGMSAALLFGFGLTESMIIGAALMFSSTIVSLKLIPTTTLHHKRSGDMMISVLLLQDILAIILILLISGGQEKVALDVAFLMLKLITLVVVSFLIVKTIVTELFRRFDTIREYSFLLSLGWGLMGAGAAEQLGLSYEIGAFIAGVAMATLPAALVIVEDLKPLRDFFLILFFFSIGAQFDFLVSEQVLVAGVALALLLMITKPFIFTLCFRAIGETKSLANELGVRLGQASEFSLLVASSAMISGHIEPRAAYLIQTVVITTFVLSTYWVVLRYPTPISSSDSQRLD